VFRVPLIVTVTVEREYIAQFLCAAFTSGRDVIYFNKIFFPKVKSAPSAFSLLFLKQFSYGRSG
jgi:hypothetical protein